MSKEDEVRCLQEVIEYGKKQHGESKRIIALLDGEDLPREENERPDFIRLSKACTKNQEEVLVGIEHFRVDHLSIRKQDGNVASTGILFSKEMERVFNKWHGKVDTEIPDNAICDLLQMIANQFVRHEGATYRGFIEAFSYSLNKHLANISAYRENLNSKHICL